MIEFDLDALEAAWEIDTGFLGQLRDGIFNEDLYKAFLTALQRITIAEDAHVPKRLVTLLWFIPPFMEWQSERVAQTITAGEYELKRVAVQNELERILGIP